METLKQAGNNSTSGGGRRRYRGNLVILEVALTLVLLAGAGLMVHSVIRLLRVNPGFDPNNLLYIKVWLPWERYEHDAGLNKSHATSADQTCDALFADMHERLASLPGVTGVGFMRVMSSEDYQIDSRTSPEELPCLACGVEDWDVFRVMRVPLLAGRYLERSDVHGALVNESLARRCWPGQNAVGKQFRRPPGASDPAVYEVVGVVSDFLGRYDEQQEPQFYVPYRSSTHWNRPRYFQAMFVRTQNDPSKLIPLIRKELKAVEPAMKAPMFIRARQAIEESVQVQRTYMVYLMVFAGAALLLSAIGLYGVLSYSVARRTREIGICMALGAKRRNVFYLVLREAVYLVAVGMLVGIVAAFWLTRLLRSQLFEISPTDPVVFIGVILVLTTVAMVASVVPAFRATRVDPMVALRYE